MQGNSASVLSDPPLPASTIELTTSSAGMNRHAADGNVASSLTSPSNSQPLTASLLASASSSSLPPDCPAGEGEAAEGDTIECAVKRYKWSPPSEAVPYRPHQGEGSQYLRDFILGVNDGLISTFLLVVGVVGGSASTHQALLTAISAAVAGAIAMGIGEYIATKSQLQVNDGEMRLEVEHFKYHRDVELLQLRQFLQSVTLSGPLLEAVVSEVGRSDESLMRMMMAFEFGVHADELERNPWKAMLMSGRLFLIGALPTVVPFFFSISPGEALGIAAGLVGVALFTVGAYKTRTTRGNWIIDGGENLTLGAIATGISYAVGVAFDKASGGGAAD